uniref:MFS domain-containing protein n=1 Tax=Steinernema glaseri TaxID=37863 RepID=A0A1I7ZWG0_9BILA
MAVLGGFLFGYDTGIVSATMLYVPQNAGMRPMTTVWKEVVISITPGMAGLGCLLAGPSADKFGRRKIIMASSLMFTIGAVICAASPEKITLLVGRILLGLAIGFASMMVPVYVGETSPAHVRGRLVACFNIMVVFGQVMSNVIGGGLSYIDPYNVGWRLMFGFAAIPALVQMVGFLFMPESPRWLYSHGFEKEARDVLNKIYENDHEWVQHELHEIAAVHAQEKLSQDFLGDRSVFWRILETPHVRKALFVGCALQAFQQLSGINTIMYYTGMIIKSAGVSNNHTIIWLSVGISSCQLIGNFVPVFFIDKLGRRMLFIISVGGVVISLLCMGGSFYAINRDSALVVGHPGNFSSSKWDEKDFRRCQALSNCDLCITDEYCGFCSKSSSARVGYCLPLDTENPDESAICDATSFGTSSTKHEWTNSFCHTRYTILPIIFMVVYLLIFAIGFSPVPWVANSEFYPTWARSTCVGVATFNNWFFNLVVSLTFLSLSEAVTKYGAFFIYAGITVIALLFGIFMLPETKGRSIDEVRSLFMPVSPLSPCSSAYLCCRKRRVEASTKWS